MLVTDTIYRYVLFDVIYAHCRLRIFRHNEQDVVVASEMPDNREVAITTYWPELAQGIANQYGLDLMRTVWIEHYPQASYAHRGERGDTFDLITFEGNEPRWQRISAEEAAALIGEPGLES